LGEREDAAVIWIEISESVARLTVFRSTGGLSSFGIPINEYCDKHRLTIKERLELFSQVCEGVQHADQKRIIRREIKPSNVLVAVQG
jgi:serine/threonine protein kinase